jgi:hypothetical protein
MVCSSSEDAASESSPRNNIANCRDGSRRCLQVGLAFAVVLVSKVSPEASGPQLLPSPRSSPSSCPKPCARWYATGSSPRSSSAARRGSRAEAEMRRGASQGAAAVHDASNQPPSESNRSSVGAASSSSLRRSSAGAASPGENPPRFLCKALRRAECSASGLDLKTGSVKNRAPPSGRFGRGALAELK